MLVRIGITLNLEPLRCSRSACNQRQAGAIPIGALVMVEPIRSAPANGWMVDWLRRIDRKRRHVEPKPLRLSIARTVESSRSIASMCPKTTYTVPLVTNLAETDNELLADPDRTRNRAKLSSDRSGATASSEA